MYEKIHRHRTIARNYYWTPFDFRPLSTLHRPKRRPYLLLIYPSIFSLILPLSVTYRRNLPVIILSICNCVMSSNSVDENVA